MEASLSNNKHTATIDATNQHDDDDSLLDWDDDESDDLLARLEERLAELPLASEDVNKKEETLVEETDDNWLAPIATTKESVASSDENGEKNVYLTDQFKRLSTPASQKKARCVVCTRPVPEGKASKYCDRHKPSNQKTVTFSVPLVISEGEK